MANKSLKLASKIGGLALIVSLLAAYGTIKLATQKMGLLPLAKADDLSTIVLDRHGKLLRAFTTKSDRWRLPVDRKSVV